MTLKILVVDDDLPVLTTLGRIFTTTVRGYLVLTATTANAGLTMLKSEQPDIMVLDVRLGPVSGMDLLKDFDGYLKAHPGTKRPHVIVITAYPDEEVKRQALHTYKVDAYLEKPFTRGRITREVAKSVIQILEAEKRSIEAILRSGADEGAEAIGRKV